MLKEKVFGMDDMGENLAAKCAGLQHSLQRLTPEPGEYRTRVKGLTLYRRESPSSAGALGWAEPHITLVFQGTEHVAVGSTLLVCGERQCRVIGVELLGTGCVASASPERPFLAVSLALDQRLISFFASSLPPSLRGGHDALKDVSVAAADPGVLDAFLRLARLLETPVDIPVLAPLIVLEIHYRLLIGPHGARCAALDRANIH